MRKAITLLLLIPFLLFYALPAEAAEKEERHWQDESIYFIMVDRFQNGNPANDGKDADPTDLKSYTGGDLKGVTDRLDYIQKMGFTAIWLTPVVDNVDGGYHGYWPKDFSKVDEHFGTMEDMKKLVKEAHKRNMKVILDYVANHTGPNHPWLNDPAKKDWFHPQQDITNWDDQTELENNWLFGLPDLNHENPDVRKFLIDNAKYWIKETGVDGFRLDAIKHIPKDFLKEFVSSIKKEYPNFFFIGEVLSEDPKYVSEYKDTGIDAFLNYPYYKEITDAFSKPGVSPDRLYNEWERDQQLYQDPYMLGTFIDNHDQVRFTRVALENKQYPPKRLRMALTYLLTSPGIPIMYYGTEIALDGGPDPDNRRIMDFKTDKDFQDYISKLGELRQQLPSLRRGTFEMLYDQDGMSVFKRTYEKETTVIAINNTTETKKVTLSSGQLAANKELRGLLSDDLVREENGSYALVLKRETANVYALAERTGLNWGFIGAIAGVYVLFTIFLILARRRRKKN
ncbi:alpha-amylase family glycosyl hydrolase [Ectobacillus ponti]|uniref:Alpha-amylase n=1 Tax=Ectobacillus ponti TaxID=2961894 RepID=A0AA41X3X3_9BACI|nr:alpha-amylase family glycosyl hydrolase [Ectobacillus ponti]MCP8968272.1 alpha-amylase family glycosyl hydrolase [Ectobacillus ponti]